MSAEHRRQLLAFFIVALAAFLLIGNGLHHQFGTRNGQVRAPATITAGPAGPGGPAISTDRSRLEPGGSARGTTATERAPSSTTRATTADASVASPSHAAPGHSDRARKTERAEHRSQAAAQKQATQRRARTGSDDVAGRTATSDTKSHAKKHGKHGKQGKKAHKHQRRHGR